MIVAAVRPPSVIMVRAEFEALPEKLKERNDEVQPNRRLPCEVEPEIDASGIAPVKLTAAYCFLKFVAASPTEPSALTGI